MSERSGTESGLVVVQEEGEDLRVQERIRLGPCMVHDQQEVYVGHSGGGHRRDQACFIRRIIYLH